MISVTAYDFFYSPQIFLCIHSYGIVRSFSNINWDSVFHKAELFQPFGFFQRRLGLAHEKIERRFTVGVKSEMLEVLGSTGIAIERNGCTGEIERTSVGRCDHLYRAWIPNVLRRTGSLQRSNGNGRIFHDRQQSGNLFRAGRNRLNPGLTRSSDFIRAYRKSSGWGAIPARASSMGPANSSKVTMAETGLPGSPK